MRNLFATATLLAVTLLAGCETFQEHETTFRLAIRFAVIEVVDGDPQKARRVVDVATDIQRLSSGDAPTTVDFLIEEIEDIVPWDDYSAAGQDLGRQMLVELREHLIIAYGDGLVPEEARETLFTIAGWMISAAGTQLG